MELPENKVDFVQDIEKSYSFKFARAGEQARDLLVSFDLMSNTLPLSHSSSLYQGKFYKGPEYNKVK